MQPGDSIQPTPPSSEGGDSPVSETAPVNEATPTTLPPAPASVPDPLATSSSEEPQAPWRYSDSAKSSLSSDDSPETVVWSALEFIDHEKTPLWYVALGFVAALLGIFAYLLTRDIITTSAVVLVIFALGIMASRKPRVLQYQLDNHGLTIGDKNYPYATLRSFSLSQYGTIDILLLRRFSVPLSLYPPAERLDEIQAKLGEYLPLEPHKTDMVEQLMHRLHF